MKKIITVGLLVLTLASVMAINCDDGTERYLGSYTCRDGEGNIVWRRTKTFATAEERDEWLIMQRADCN